jgi:D-amino peptidase
MRPDAVVSRLLAAGAILGTACARPPKAGPVEARTLETPRPPTPGKLRVLLTHDMEGLAGQDDWRTYRIAYPEHFRRGQALLAAEVNAVVDGLFAGGATAVEVFDQHGSGQPDSIPDLPPALLDPRANQVFMTEAISAEQAAARDYDAVVHVAGHGRTGSGGFAAHTFTLGIAIALNGLPITEAELIGYQWGQYGVPLIFAAGDSALCENLRPNAWIDCVATKRGTSVSTAELRPVAEVYQELRAGAKRALEQRGEKKVMRLTTPIRVTMGTTPPARLGPLAVLPGLAVSDGAVNFTVPDLGPAAFFTMVGIVEIASGGARSDILAEVVRGTPAGARSLWLADSIYFQRWLDLEKPR